MKHMQPVMGGKKGKNIKIECDILFIAHAKNVCYIKSIKMAIADEVG